MTLNFLVDHALFKQNNNAQYIIYTRIFKNERVCMDRSPFTPVRHGTGNRTGQMTELRAVTLNGASGGAYRKAERNHMLGSPDLQAHTPFDYKTFCISELLIRLFLKYK